MLKLHKTFLIFFALLFLPQFQIYAIENGLEEEPLPYEISVENSEYCSMGNIRTFNFSSTGKILITISSPSDIFKYENTYYVNLYDADHTWITTFKIDAMGYLAAHFNEQDEIELYLDRHSKMFVIDTSGRLVSSKSRDIDVMDVQKTFIEKDGIAYYRDIIGKKIYYTSNGEKYILFQLSSSLLPTIVVVVPALLVILLTGLLIVCVRKKNHPTKPF